VTARTRIAAANTLTLAEYRAGQAKSEPVRFSQLLTCPAFRGRLQAEERLTIEIATRLRELSLDGSLRATWTHVAHESALASTLRIARIIGAKKAAMGAIAGAADFVFVWSGGGGWIEVKVDERAQTRLAVEDGPNGPVLRARDGTRGQLSTSQRQFRSWCGSTGARYEIVRSVEEMLATLRLWGVLG
jgi:hypothetical protein